MKPKNIEDLFKKKKKKIKENESEIDPGSDHPVHEKYTKEEPTKE